MTAPARLIRSTWPRMMKRATAAAFCDLSESAFLREVNDGRLPHPVTLGGSPHWSITQLERSLASLSGEITSDDDWRKGSPLYVE